MGLLSEIKRIKFAICQIYNQYISPLDSVGYGKIGKKSIIKNNSTFNKANIYIDDWAVIQDQLNLISFHGKLKVGKFSVISSGCTIIPSSHRLTVGVPFYLSAMSHLNDNEGEIIIEEDCWIGAGCLLLPKCHIGRGAVVGAGAVVNRAIPPYAVVVGVPSRIIAAKFTIEQIIKHEKVLYPPEERMTKIELEKLFDKYFKGLKTIGIDCQDDIIQDLEYNRKRYGIINYQAD